MKYDKSGIIHWIKQIMRKNMLINDKFANALLG